jgi:hypothetical protein
MAHLPLPQPPAALAELGPLLVPGAELGGHLPAVHQERRAFIPAAVICTV